MIKRLRIKFICVVMSIVLVLLLGIFAVFIGFTGNNLQQQSLSMMRAVAANSMQMQQPGGFSESIRLPYFVVVVTSRGEALVTDSGNFDLSDEGFLLELVYAARRSGEDVGTLTEYGLRYLRQNGPMGQTIVFADITTETKLMQNLVYTSLLILAGALVIFLGVAILLARWVSRPVEKAWNQQRQFVADASHELKTPLSVIMANGELLQGENLSEEERNRFSGNILTTSYQMRGLVENMLEMARVDNGTLKMKLEKLDFSQLVNDAVLSFQLLYEEAGLQLCSDIPEGIALQGSEQHLYQVLDVLLDNALKYSQPYGPIWVSLHDYGKNCLLMVDNPGQTLTPEEQKLIFKRFYRADQARTRDGSYGLGLSIADGIVKAHKGKIWAEAIPGGNRFVVQLPIL